jgi:hypothetical protein
LYIDEIPASQVESMHGSCVFEGLADTFKEENVREMLNKGDVLSVASRFPVREHFPLSP